jgi:uncharacterized protein YciI
MTEFIYVIRPVRADMLASGMTAEEQAVMAAHFAYLQDGARAGVVRLAGRTDTSDAATFGICIFEAADKAAAAAFTAADPAVARGVVRAEVHAFRTAIASAK